MVQETISIGSIAIFCGLALLVILILLVCIHNLLKKRREDQEWSGSLASAAKASEMDHKPSCHTAQDSNSFLRVCEEDNEDDGDDWDDEDDEEEESPEIYFRPGFYVCDDCGAEFRLTDGVIPKRCPSCGVATFKEEDEEPEDEEDTVRQRCPHCGKEFLTLDGEDPDYCPYCESERDACEDWAVYVGAIGFRRGYWTCYNCDHEFRMNEDGDIPRVCPNCGETLVNQDPKDLHGDEDESVNYKCRSCGKAFTYRDAKTDSRHIPIYCPHCGAKGTLSDTKIPEE